MDKAYIETVRLLLESVPIIFEAPHFAMKGGTAAAFERKLREEMSGLASVSGQSDGRTLIRLSGPKLRAMRHVCVAQLLQAIVREMPTYATTLSNA